MSKYVLFTAGFWKDTTERVVWTAAQAVAAVYGADQFFPNAFDLDYKALGGVAAGAAFGAFVKALGKLGVTAQTTRPPTDDEIRKFLEEQDSTEGA